MCAWMCGMIAEAGGWRASEQSCLICAWGEKYPRVQCVMESKQNGEGGGREGGICGSQT